MTSATPGLHDLLGNRRPIDRQRAFLGSDGLTDAMSRVPTGRKHWNRVSRASHVPRFGVPAASPKPLAGNNEFFTYLKVSVHRSQQSESPKAVSCHRRNTVGKWSSYSGYTTAVVRSACETILLFGTAICCRVLDS